MADLEVEMGPLRLKNPLIIGAGPSTRNYTNIVKAIEAGSGAVVVRSLHVMSPDEQRQPVRSVFRVFSPENVFGDGLYSFQSTSAPARRIVRGVDPGLGGATRTPTLEQWAEVIARLEPVAGKHGCHLIGSIGWCGTNMPGLDVWEAEARAMTEAGVSALELHTSPSPPCECARFVQVDPDRYLVAPIRAVKRVSSLPVFVKLGVDCCDLIGVARLAQIAGADGVVPTTRWISLDVDVENETEKIWRLPGIGGPWSAPIMCGLIYRLRHGSGGLGSGYASIGQTLASDESVTIPIIPSGGVKTDKEVLQYLLSGASAVQICTQILMEGYGLVPRILEAMEQWMDRRGYSRIEDFCGTVRLHTKETFARELRPHPLVNANLCTGCGRCIECCWNQAPSLREGLSHIERERCEGCQACRYVCPVGAISMKWEEDREE
ncbi:MAG: 4Fe-4S binding protein [Deltaproteobacteria bacterium]|nr:4Fe-4S binding protein [Deltaproteobacteria bacterium]